MNSTAPTIATPSAPPIERDTDTEATAEASDALPPALCTMICVGGMVVPSPAPASSVNTSTTEVGAKVTVAASAANARVETASPRFGYAVSRPGAGDAPAGQRRRCGERQA